MVLPKIRVVAGPPQETMQLLYRHMYLLNFPPIVALAHGGNYSVNDWVKNHTISYSALYSMLSMLAAVIL